jgi:hypothetical protein
LSKDEKTGSQTGKSNKNQHDPVAMYALLDSNADIAREASLDGEFSGGSKTLVMTYNRVIKALSEMGYIDEALFQEAASDSTMDEIGILSAHLAHFVKKRFNIRGSEAVHPSELVPEFLKRAKVDEELKPKRGKNSA